MGSVSEWRCLYSALKELNAVHACITPDIPPTYRPDCKPREYIMPRMHRGIQLSACVSTALNGKSDTSD